MPYLRTYQIFISHAWHRSEHYSTVVRWLNDAPYLSWNNLSVPEHEPFHVTDSNALAYELHRQMRHADVFIILGGMYAAHSEWIDYELYFARRIGRPIIGVRPWGAQVMPSAITKAAHHIVGWNGASVVSAVRSHALPSVG